MTQLNQSGLLQKLMNHQQQQRSSREKEKEQPVQVIEVPSILSDDDSQEDGDALKDDADNKQTGGSGSAGGPEGTSEKKKGDKTESPPVAFTRAYLRQRHENVINGLYFDLTHQCPQTGKRFRTKAQLQRHLDLVYQRKKLMREGQPSRKWYVNLDQWKQSVLSNAMEGDKEDMDGGAEGGGGEGNPGGNTGRKRGETSMSDILKSDPSKLELSVWADPSHSACPLSKEKFQVFYNDDDDQWHFKDAVKLMKTYQGLAPGTIVSIKSLPADVRETVALIPGLHDKSNKNTNAAKRQKRS